MSRVFTAIPGIREQVPLLIGLGGPPGSGKTYSALVIATGIKSHRGGNIVVIDTEKNRSKAYAPRKGEKADGVNTFDFLHVPFDPPFRSLDFRDAVRQQLASKPAAIIIDSASDEHEGDGGLLDFHDSELERMAGNDWSKRERVGQAAWIKPKGERREMMNDFLQIMTPLIFCFRAREKTKQVQNDKGKMTPTNIGWTPIAPPEIVHSMTLFCLLPIRSDGVPMWRGNTAYEDFSIKLPRQFQGIFPEKKPIDAEMGYRMSEWAMGDAGDNSTTKATEPEKPADPVAEYGRELRGILKGTADEITQWWAATGQRRIDIGVPDETLKKMEAAVMEKVNG
jgi:hypothetical protein